MLKMKSEIIGAKIWHSDVRLGLVRNLVIEPSNGKILALGLDKSCAKIIPYDEVFFMIGKFFTNHLDVVFDSVDIIRIKEILSNNLLIDGKPVVTLSGTKVGKITDYMVDLQCGFLDKVEVSKNYIFYKKTVLIPDAQIYEITAAAVVILDDTESVMEPIEETKKAEPILDPAT